jgi:APA family basic amino acid/polyamine antiporter
MIGTGVFSTLSFQVHALPDERAILLLWVVGGLAALAGALCYAELGAMHPRSGGEYSLLTRLVHPATGFAAGWISLVAGFAGPIAAAALAFAAYLGKLWPWVSGADMAIALALVTAVSAVHLLRVEIGARFQVITTLAKILVMLAIVLAALILAPEQASLQGETTALLASPAFAASLVWVTYAYFGWNAALYVAGEVRQPQRNLPLALLGGTLAVTALYVAVNWAFLRLIPIESLLRIDPASASVENELAVGFLAGRALFGETGAIVVGAAIALTLVSTVSAMLLAGPRVLAAMAEDWPPLAVFGRRHAGGSPRIALAFLWLLTSLLLVTTSFAFVIRFIGVSLTLFNVLVVGAFLVERWRRPTATRPFRAPLGILSALCFQGLQGWMLVFLAIEDPLAVGVSAGTVVLALGAWWPLRHHAAPTPADRDPR